MRRLYEKALVRLQGLCTSACTSASDIAVAARRLHKAYTMLGPYAAQVRFHKQVRDAPHPITSTLRCPIDVGALRAFSAKHSSSVGQTIHKFLRSVTKIDDDTGYIDIQYRHSALTAALIDAGWLTDGRECTVGADSFKYLIGSCATLRSAGLDMSLMTAAPGPGPLLTSSPALRPRPHPRQQL